MEVVLAGEQVGRRQAHERKARAVRAAADRTFDRLETSAANGVTRVVDHLRVAFEHLAHVPVRLLDHGCKRGAGMDADALTSQLLDEPRLLRETRRRKVPEEDLDACL